MVILYSKKFQVESEFQKGHQHGHFIIKKKIQVKYKFQKGHQHGHFILKKNSSPILISKRAPA